MGDRRATSMWVSDVGSSLMRYYRYYDHEDMAVRMRLRELVYGRLAVALSIRTSYFRSKTGS